MSGPDDTPNDDFKLPIPEAGATLSPKYRLRLHWDTPRLEWSPLLATHAPPDKPTFLKLDDPFAAVLGAEQYILDGKMLFDMQRLNFDMIDKAFVQAPVAPPNLLPSFAEMKAWEDDAFYRRLGRKPPLLGAPAPTPLLIPPIAGPTPPSPFYKLPSPLAFNVDPATPRVGKAGDIYKAVMGLPIMQQNMNRLTSEALKQVRVIKTDWKDMSWQDRVAAIAIATPLAAGVAGTVIGVGPARNLTFNLLKGVDVPAPFVPGVSVQVDDFGRADPFLLGAPADPHQPQALRVMLKFDVLKAFPAFAKKF